MTATFHLGIDLGTAWSKLGLRHYEARGGDRTYILFQPGTKDPTFPSLVAWDGHRLYFGIEAEQRDGQPGYAVFRSLKMLFAYPDAYWPGKAPDLPPGMSIDDVFTLLAAYLLQVGHAVAEKTAKQHGVKQFRMSMTVGMPIDHMDRPGLRDRYRALATAAYSLYQAALVERLDLKDGISVQDALSRLAQARTTWTLDDDFDDTEWLRGEATAALLWAYNSPRTKPGRLYFDLDVGAGTASASSFMINQEHSQGRWIKTSIGYYGAACAPPAADKCASILVDRFGASFSRVRGRENEFIARLADSDSASRKVLDLAQTIFRLLAKVLGDADRKLDGHGSMANCSLFLFGGGARIESLRRYWVGQPFRYGVDGPPALCELDAPPDMVGEDGKALPEGSLDRVLVAYGLSHFAGDVPESLAPDNFHPIVPRRPRVCVLERDELYPA